MSRGSQRVLVTGGAGFVGSHVVDLLVERGADVVVLDSLVAHGGRRPPWLGREVDLVVGDVRDPDAWRRALPGVDAVCHQAARVGLGVDFGDVTAYVDDNDAGTATGLRVLHDHRFRGRLVLASSMVVYGEGRYRCPDHGDVRPGPRTRSDLAAGRFEPPCPACGAALAWAPIGEDAPLDPRNVYAATKLHQEHLCALFAREHDGVTTTALRYHNVYGPRMPCDTPYAGVASIFRSAVARGQVPQVYEDGRQTRDFVHVRDVARANVAALTARTPVPGPLNVASGVPRTVLDLAEAACRGTDLVPVVVGGGRTGDVRHVVASPERAAALLGFRATEPFTPAAVAP
ncbi:MAG TPA: NAD-dependent epimerase/dehydratase family protein [Acidimicrobiales bacterium]|nr:NAD-dependent epimerase/dehydratase family protein [Acidimicrobiales bacterium]